MSKGGDGMATVGRLAIVLTASATDFERTMGRAARAVKSTEKEFNQSARRMQDIGRKWSLGLTAPIVAGITAVSKAAITWEDTFADVRTTVQGTEAQIQKLDKALRKMTERIPLSHKQLSEIAGIAGRFGIHVDNVAEFTDTMAKFGAVARVELETAAMGIAQIDNIMGTGQKAFERYGSAILRLGHSLPTTEQKIVDFALQTAGAGRIAGLTAAQVLAIAGSFSAFGVRAQVGGTAVSKVLAKLSEAVATGNQDMRLFAAVAGMSAQEFATAWRDDAGEAFVRFVEGLGKSGDQAFAILRNLGLSDQRLVRAFISVAQAEGFLRDKMALGAKAWEENIYLAERAEKRYKTVANRFKMLGSRIKNVAIIFGESLLPMINAVVDRAEKVSDGLGRMAEGFAKLPGPVQKTTINALLLLAAIGPLMFFLGLVNRTIAGVIGVTATLISFAGNAVFAFESWKLGAATLGESLAYLAGGKIKLVILAISALVVASIWLLANWEKVKAGAMRVWGAISGTVLYAASLIVRGVGMIVTALSWLLPGLRNSAQAVMGWADSLKSAAQSAWGGVGASGGGLEKVAESAEDLAETGKAAADSQQDLADGIAKAGKAAKRNLQSFDEVHLLEDSMASDTPDFDFGFDFEDFAMPTMADAFGGITDTLANAAETAAIAWESGTSRIGGAWQSLKTWAYDTFPSLEKVVGKFGELATWVHDNWDKVKPVLEGVAGVLLLAGAAWLALNSPVAAFLALVGLVALAATWVIDNWETVGPWFEGLWNGIKDVAGSAWSNIVQTATTIWNGLKAFWDQWGGQITDIFRQLSKAASEIWSGIVETAQYLWGLLQAFWQKWGSEIVATVETLWGAVVSVISGAIETVISIWNTMVGIAVFIWDRLKAFWSVWGETITAMFGGLWRGLSIIVETAINLIKDIILFVLAVIRGDWDAAWGYICDAANTVWEFLVKSWQNLRQTASDIWKGIVNVIIKAVNWMIRGLNKLKISIPDWVKYVPGLSKLAGQTWGIKISEIPLLRAGTNYVPRDTLAYLHQGEAVVPKQFNPAVHGVDSDEIAGAVYRAIIDGMRVSQASGPQPSGDREFVFRIDSTTLARAILPAIIKEGQRQGLDLVVRPQGV
jgi:TP901 family phage tail tape measure protein